MKAQVTSLGDKKVVFKDGGSIKFSNNNDQYSGVIAGTIGHQLVGKIVFYDRENELFAEITYGAYYFSKQHYFHGYITKNGAKLSEIKGTYAGYCDFDGVRYWDYREKNRVCYYVDYEVPADQSLPSQSSKRTDGLFKKEKTIEEA